MTDVTNNHVTGLGMPDGTSIASRETKAYANWAENAKNAVVSHWVSAGLLSVDGFDGEEEQPSNESDSEEDGEGHESTEGQSEESEEDVGEEEEGDEPADEKAALIASLAEMGVEVDGRTGVKKLRAMLDEALAQ